MVEKIDNPYLTGHQFQIKLVEARIKKTDLVAKVNEIAKESKTNTVCGNTLYNYIKGAPVLTSSIDKFVNAFNQLLEESWTTTR